MISWVGPPVLALPAAAALADAEVAMLEPAASQSSG
jgi:hypothetical protein